MGCFHERDEKVRFTFCVGSKMSNTQTFLGGDASLYALCPSKWPLCGLTVLILYSDSARSHLQDESSPKLLISNEHTHLYKELT